MIEIMNMRTDKPEHEYDVRVDRNSVLGNPFKMAGEFERNNVCMKYKDWLEDKLNIECDQDVIQEILILRALYEQYGKLRLFCWCHPKNCHAGTIREFILR